MLYIVEVHKVKEMLDESTPWTLGIISNMTDIEIEVILLTGVMVRTLENNKIESTHKGGTSGVYFIMEWEFSVDKE